MGSRFRLNQFSNLYEYWADRITDAVNADLTHHKNSAVINLSSNEYFKVIQPKRLIGKVITPVFKEVKDGNSRVIGILAKKARGMMARFMIEERMSEPDGLKSFKMDGYMYRPEQSDQEKWVFTRDHIL